MQKSEHRKLVQVYDAEAEVYYWADDKEDERPVIERLDDLGEDGWELAARYNTDLDFEIV